MKRRRGNQQGQSIIEYLVVVAAVIAAILAIGGIVQPRVTNLGTVAGERVDASAATITANVIPSRQ